MICLIIIQFLKTKSMEYINYSGTFLKDVTSKSGFITCRHKPLKQNLLKIKTSSQKAEIKFDQLTEQYKILESSYGISSIETSFHLVIPSTYILHTHPVYINIFSCMEGGEQILTKILKDLPSLFLPYHNPGLALGLALSKYKNLPKIIILKNHGVITHSNNPTEALLLTNKVNQILIKYLKSKKVYRPFKIENKSANLSKHLFPDSAVYAQINFSKLSEEKQRVYYEICSAHNYILNTITALKEKPVFLKPKDVDYILNMTKEKYRIDK